MISRFFPSILLITLLGLITSCSSREKKEEALVKKANGPKPPTRADAAIAVSRQMYDYLDIPGTLVANEATEIHPEVAGKITGIFFKEGAYIPKGALLVKLYDADLQAQKQKLLVQIRIAEQNQSRTAQLLKIGGISRQDYENTELTTSNAKADLAVLTTNILKTEIRAPFSGKLGLRMVSVGAYVSNATVITTISQLNQMRVDFTVPEKYSGQIKAGQIINFTVPGSTRTYAAKVFATESNISQSTRTLQVRAAVMGNPGDLVPGGFAKVALNFQPEGQSVVIPSQAIIPEARGKKIFVYNDGIAKYVDVTTGLRDSANVQVTSGVKAGDTVLISGLLALKPNGKVKIGRIANSSRKTAP